MIHFFFYIPLTCLSLILLILPLFSKLKKIKLLIFFIISILILKGILHHNIIDYFLIGFLDIFKGFNFQRVDRIVPITYSLLFVLYLSFLKSENLKKLFYFMSLLSIICIQLKMPLPPITQYLLQKKPFHFQEVHIKNFWNTYYKLSII